ncbi:MAG TPA: TIM-barrel domain-containing protein [Pyrinomonadaceae bacterium]|jgi:alpha-glucosidase|nr:TIM-barrel domain-containing protein [Pyrinomonadaceae bacterium]
MRRHTRRALALSLLCLLALSAAEARAAWRAAGDVSGVERQADGVVLVLTSGARVAVTFRDIETVRVRLAPSGTFERDLSYAVESKDRKTVAAAVTETPDEINISSLNGTTVVVKRRPFLVTVKDADGRTIVEDDPARPHSFDPETGAVEATKLRVEWETYFGLGEKAAPTFYLNSQRFVMWNTDTYGYPRGLDPIYQSVGFYTALRREQGRGLAYGLFLDNTSRAYFDMGKTDPARLTFGAASGELNYYVFTGGRERTPRNVLRDYTDLTGRAPLPPLWALGNQQSRWSYFPESRVREVARRFRETRTPLDVLYLDIDYMDGYRVFTWDKTRFPDPARLISDLKAEGIRVVLIIDPGIKADPDYFVYQQGRQGNHFVKTEDGKELNATVWPGVCAFPDFTDAKAREWFGSLYGKHLDEGVAGFWNDMNEPGVFLSDQTPKPDLYHHPMKTFPLTARHAGDGLPGTHARYHNVYGMQMARATFEGNRRLRPDSRPLVITRAGYAGVQRYSAVWTGDNVASWDHLRLSVTMLLNLGVSGVPFVGSDVGGFSGNPSPELYARWLQAAALSPFFRSHSEYVSKPHEPFAFGPEFTDINRKTIELRYRLLPYLYTAFREHARRLARHAPALVRVPLGRAHLHDRRPVPRRPRPPRRARRRRGRDEAPRLLPPRRQLARLVDRQALRRRQGRRDRRAARPPPPLRPRRLRHPDAASHATHGRDVEGAADARRRARRHRLKQLLRGRGRRLRLHARRLAHDDRLARRRPSQALARGRLRRPPFPRRRRIPRRGRGPARSPRRQPRRHERDLRRRLAPPRRAAPGRNNRRGYARPLKV